MRLAILTLLILPGFALADDPAKVTFPAIPSVVVAPAPGDVPALSSGAFYLVTSDTPFILIASPVRLVNIVPEVGPLTIRGIFVDGTGKVETRKVTAKYIAIVDAIDGSSGRVELMAIPHGVTDEADITRRMVDVGHAPQPPPTPDVDPQPEPIPPIPTPAGLRVIMIYETSADNTAAQMAVLFSPTVSKWLKDNSKGWRRFDPDVVVSDREDRDIASMWSAVKQKLTTLPQVAIAVGGKVDVYPLPATEAAMLELLKGAK